MTELPTVVTGTVSVPGQYKNQTFRFADIEESCLGGSTFENCTFLHCRFGDRCNSTFTACRMYGSTLPRMWNGSTLTNCTMERCNGYQMSQCHATITNCVFDMCLLSNAKFREVQYCLFDACEMSYSYFRRDTKQGTRFKSCSLHGMTGIRFAQVAFTDHGECGRMLTKYHSATGWVYQCGCFEGTRQDLLDWIEEEYRERTAGDEDDNDTEIERKTTRLLAVETVDKLCH